MSTLPDSSCRKPPSSTSTVSTALGTPAPEPRPPRWGPVCRAWNPHGSNRHKTRAVENTASLPGAPMWSGRCWEPRLPDGTKPLEQSDLGTTPVSIRRTQTLGSERLGNKAKAAKWSLSPHTPSLCTIQSINTHPGWAVRGWEAWRTRPTHPPALARVTRGHRRPVPDLSGETEPGAGEHGCSAGSPAPGGKGSKQRGGRGGGVWVKARAGGPWQDVAAHGCWTAEGKQLPSEGHRLHAGFGWFQREWTKPWNPHLVLSPPQPGAPQPKPRSGPLETSCPVLLTPALASLPSTCLACPGASQSLGLLRQPPSLSPAPCSSPSWPLPAGPGGVRTL